MTYQGLCHLSLRACLTALLLAWVTGCESPSAPTTEDGGTPGPADSQTRAAAETSPAAEEPANASPDASPNEADEESEGDSQTAASAASGARLAGRVAFDGEPPERRVINMTKDAKCIELHGDQPVLDEDLLVSDDGGVKNAFVYVRRGAPKKDYRVPDEPARLDQKDCMYRPRVQGMLLGQKLLVGNSDPVTHNVRSFPIRSRPFNFGQPPDSEPRERVFDAAEREIEVQCDIHPWMHAYLFVMDHPFFAVTDEDGAYAIEGLPPGEYTLEAWHEKLGRKRQTVAIGDVDPPNVDFTYAP